MPTPTKVTQVRPRHVVWGSVWMVLLVTGGLVQTHLRFSERDMEIQTRQAQEELISLADDKVALQAQVQRLRSGQEVRDRAVTELGLVPASPTEVHRLEIDADLWTKYAGAGAGTDIVRRDSGESEPAWMAWIDRTVNVADTSAESGMNR